MWCSKMVRTMHIFLLLFLLPTVFYGRTVEHRSQPASWCEQHARMLRFATDKIGSSDRYSEQAGLTILQSLMHAGCRCRAQQEAFLIMTIRYGDTNSVSCLRNYVQSVPCALGWAVYALFLINEKQVDYERFSYALAQECEITALGRWLRKSRSHITLADYRDELAVLAAAHIPVLPLLRGAAQRLGLQLLDRSSYVAPEESDEIYTKAYQYTAEAVQKNDLSCRAEELYSQALLWCYERSDVTQSAALGVFDALVAQSSNCAEKAKLAGLMFRYYHVAAYSCEKIIALLANLPSTATHQKLFLLLHDADKSSELREVLHNYTHPAVTAQLTELLQLGVPVVTLLRNVGQKRDGAPLYDIGLFIYIRQLESKLRCAQINMPRRRRSHNIRDIASVVFSQRGEHAHKHTPKNTG